MNSFSMICDYQSFFADISQAQKCEIAKAPDCVADFDFINFANLVYCGMDGSWGGFIPLGLFIGMLIFSLGSFLLLSKNIQHQLLPISLSGSTYQKPWEQSHSSPWPMGIHYIIIIQQCWRPRYCISCLQHSRWNQLQHRLSLWRRSLRHNLDRRTHHNQRGRSRSITSSCQYSIYISSTKASGGMLDCILQQHLQSSSSASQAHLEWQQESSCSVSMASQSSLPTSLKKCTPLSKKNHKKKIQKLMLNHQSQFLKGTLIELITMIQENDPKVAVDISMRNIRNIGQGINRFKQAVKKVQVENIKRKLFNMCIMKLEKLRQKREDVQTFSEMGIVDKIFFIIDFPFVYIKKITMPSAEEEQYSKLWTTISITPGLLIYSIIIMKGFYWWQLYAVLPIGLAITVAIYFTAKEDKVPSYYPLLEIFAVLGSLIWTYLVSGILIDLLNFVGILTNLSKPYLGMTIIAMGNALPDALTTIALSKQGYAIMGMTGAYAGQLFGLLVGLGLSVIKLSLSSAQTDNFQLFTKADIIEIIVIFTILGTLSFTFVYGLLKKYKFDRMLAYVLSAAYITLFIVVTIIAVIQAFK